MEPSGDARLEDLYERLLNSTLPESFDDDKASQSDVSKEIHKWYDMNGSTWEEIVGRALGHTTESGKEVTNVLMIKHVSTCFAYLIVFPGL
jgi:hypothetical protein